MVQNICEENKTEHNINNYNRWNNGKPTAMYGCEPWSMTESDKVMLHTHDSNILRKVCIPVTEKGV
jgi:hypothetical protein